MKVALVNGQNHKGSTYHMGRMLAEKLASSEDITEVFLPRDLPQFCCGCTQCIMKDEKLCPHYSYVKPIAEILDSSDVLIFDSPVYVYHVTGSMKALLDHFAYRWLLHRPEEKMFSKQAVCLTTAAGGGMKSACRDMKHSMFYWGVGKIYSCGMAVFAASWDHVSDKKKAEMDRKTSVLAEKIKRKTGKVKPSIKAKLFFSVFRKLNGKDSWNPADAEYWKEKGWTASSRPWKTIS